MSVERYPADLLITDHDFHESGWKSVLSSTNRDGYPSMWQGFSAAARQAMEEGRRSHGKVLWLLADACSMMLSPKSINDPFKPLFAMEGGRSVIPEDLSEADIMFFAQIVDVVDDLWLKARVADLVWLNQQPREVRFALAAIDAYRLIPLDTKTWMQGGHECWKRSIGLSRMLKAGAGNRLTEIEAEIVQSFKSATKSDGSLGLWLADLLEENGLGRNHKETIAQKLETLAKEFDIEGDLPRAREFFGASAKWFKTAGDKEKCVLMTVAVAEGCVKEAVARVSSKTPSHMVAASFYENAIQTYRTIPRAQRAAHRVDERIVELHANLNDSGEKSLGEMGVISTPGGDIGQIMENSRNAVRGKSSVEALNAFVNLHCGTKAKDLRAKSIKRLGEHPLSAMISATMVSRDGRVIAKRPGMSLGAEPSADDEIVIRSEMIQEHGIMVGIVAQGIICPAHEVMLLEHRLREVDFIGLTSQSPIVPKGRERLFGKALFAGYDRDFVTALHLLVPQIEHMVRFHLNQSGVKTTNLDSNGIETENGLSTLIDLPETGKILGGISPLKSGRFSVMPLGRIYEMNLRMGCLMTTPATLKTRSMLGGWALRSYLILFGIGHGKIAKVPRKARRNEYDVSARNPYPVCVVSLGDKQDTLRR